MGFHVVVLVKPFKCKNNIDRDRVISFLGEWTGIRNPHTETETCRHGKK